MINDLQPAVLSDEFQPILTELATLTRDHFLYYRLQVGSLILDHFFGGSAAAYSDRDPTKEQRFSGFIAQHGEDLEYLGLKEHTLRQCVVLSGVFATLPDVAKKQLGYTRTLALVRMTDPTMRAKLAMTAIAEKWTVTQLRQAVDAARAGLWYDTDPVEPGVQSKPLPTPEPLAATPQVGRMVSRAERWSADLKEFSVGWATIDPTKATSLQRKRLSKALAEAIANLQQLAAAIDK